jgi:hypothetical protein
MISDFRSTKFEYVYRPNYVMKYSYEKHAKDTRNTFAVCWCRGNFKFSLYDSVMKTNSKRMDYPHYLYYYQYIIHSRTYYRLLCL